ncbi:MAG: hypothetical protein IPP90_11365 [Gemmatimonadaceae bacterium]|nr:hypothetical protein [Gemmatimonadaceae bacterium]
MKQAAHKILRQEYHLHNYLIMVPPSGTRSIVGVATLLGICALTAWWPAPLRAQAPAYFKALTVPPSTVGTCLEPALNPDITTRRRSAPRLVISSRMPDARREMSLVRDSTGAVIGFNERVNVSTGRFASAGESIIASLRADGRVVGVVMRTEIQMSDTGLRSFDSASLRRMRESAKQTSHQLELDASGQAQVRVLVAWLSTRCPG